jgi:uncharacterized protein YkwD
VPDPNPPSRIPRALPRLRAKDGVVLSLLVALWLQFRADAGDVADAPAQQPSSAPVQAAPLQTTRAVGDEAPPPLVTAAAPPSYAEGSPERAVFDALNEVRARGNFGLLAQDERLDAVASSHAAYMARNLGGAISHRQQAERPGFSGETPIDRIRAAGYDTRVSFEAISSGSTARACLELLNTVYHLGALTVGATDVGIAFEPGGGCVIEPQLPGRHAALQARAPGTTGVYPYPGQVGVPTAFMPATETPNPAPDLGDAVVGPPILVDLNSAAAAGLAPSDIVVARFTLAEATEGPPVSARVLASANVVAAADAGLDLRLDRRLVSTGHVFLLPLQPLKAATAYTVEWHGSIGGVDVSRRWGFTTR